jgi:anthranilate/para-aminobenzoate synthase component I
LRQNLALLNYLIDTVPKIDELPDFNGGLVGYFGYEIIRYIEPKFAVFSLVSIEIVL